MHLEWCKKIYQRQNKICRAIVQIQQQLSPTTWRDVGDVWQGEKNHLVWMKGGQGSITNIFNLLFKIFFVFSVYTTQAVRWCTLQRHDQTYNEQVIYILIFLISYPIIIYYIFVYSFSEFSRTHFCVNATFKVTGIKFHLKNKLFTESLLVS